MHAVLTSLVVFCSFLLDLPQGTSFEIFGRKKYISWDQLTETHPHFLVIASSSCTSSSWSYSMLQTMINAHKRSMNAIKVYPEFVIGPWICYKKHAKSFTAPWICNKTQSCERTAKLATAWNRMVHKNNWPCANTSLNEVVMMKIFESHIYYGGPDGPLKVTNFVGCMLLTFLRLQVLFGNPYRVINLSRKNPLDHVICQVRDCFDKHHGYPVNASGSRMNMCFRRRALTNASSTDPSEADKKFKVFLNVDTLAHRLTMSEKTQNWHWKLPIKQKVKTFYSEDFSAFEYSDEINDYRWNVSRKGIKRALQELAAPADEDVIQREMIRMVTGPDGKRFKRHYHNHSTLIYNAEAIREVLKGTVHERWFRA
eukprot:m.59956 g.59956  ORF g.59956 m.59956 type:complete len:369 (+) comp11284_c0_seq1:208-1314(+)